MFSHQHTQYECMYPVIKETIPETALGYATNNKYPSFPPLMSDGRSITATYQPESSIHRDILERNGLTTNWEYRNYMTKNAKEIMDANFRESSNDIGYYKRPIDIPSIQSNTLVGSHYQSPYRFSSVLDKGNDKRTIGSGSDLKDIYMTREQLDARKISPIV